MVYMLALLILASALGMVMFGISSMHGSIYGMQASIEAHERALTQATQAHEKMKEKLSQWRNVVTMDTKQAVNSQDKQLADVLQRLERLEMASASQQQALDNAQASLTGAEKAWEEESKELALRSSADEEAQRDFAGKLKQLQRVVDSLKRGLEDTVAVQPRVETAKRQGLGAEAVPGQRTLPPAGRREASSPQGLAGREPRQEPDAQGQRAPERGEREPQTTELPVAPDAQGDRNGALLLGRSGRPALEASAGPALPSSSQAPGAVVAARGGAEAPTTSKAGVGGEFHVAWFRECGCTGMEIEAVTLLRGLADRIGATRVRTNACGDTCRWPAAVRTLLDEIEVPEERLWACPLGPGGPDGLACVLGVHAAFVGVCGLPDSLAPREAPSSVLRVSRSMLETDRLDRASAARCNEFDAVWVPTDFNVRTFSESGVERPRLAVLPEAVDPALFNCTPGAAVDTFGIGALDGFVAAGSPSGALRDAFKERGPESAVFTFLSVFKWEDRKNWRALLEAFASCFPRNLTEVTLEDGRRANVTVRLLIKTQYLSWGTNPEDDILDLFAGSPAEESLLGRLLVLTESLPTELVPMLYRAADAFVLPTHGEGWGLPLMEAMASGLPTIATGWGGQTEFMSADNSFLVPFKLVPSMGEEHLWAEPEAAQLQEAMRKVLRRTGEVQLKSQRACSDVASRYTPAAVASRFESLVAHMRLGAAKAS